MDSLIAGGFAGLAVDLVLFPLDSIKTRLQSKRGFQASGGIYRLYRGVGVLTFVSIPSGSIFFGTYDTIKSFGNRSLPAYIPNEYLFLSTILFQGFASIAGEFLACFIRVPLEMLKQQIQAGYHNTHMSSLSIIRQTLKNSQYSRAGLRNLYCGFLATISRDIPFAFCQMTMYEACRKFLIKDSPKHFDELTPILAGQSEGNTPVQHYTNGDKASAWWLFPVIGAISAATASFVTAPLDMVRTRIMLRESSTSRPLKAMQELLAEEKRHLTGTPSIFSSKSGKYTCKQVFNVLNSIRLIFKNSCFTCHKRIAPKDTVILKNHYIAAHIKDASYLWFSSLHSKLYQVVYGTRILYRGSGTRILWITCGGAVFFPVYEAIKALLNDV